MTDDPGSSPGLTDDRYHRRVEAGRCVQGGEASITPGPEVAGLMGQSPKGANKGRFSVLLLLSPVIHRRASWLSPQSAQLPRSASALKMLKNVLLAAL